MVSVDQPIELGAIPADDQIASGFERREDGAENSDSRRPDATTLDARYGRR